MAERDPLRLVLGTCAAQIGAISSSIISPLIIGGLIIGLGINEIEAGSLFTLELMIMGVGSMVLAPMMLWIPQRLLAGIGVISLIIAHFFSSQSTAMAELYGWRILAGVACACLLATVNAAIAQARAPVLLYGLAWAAAYTVTAVLAIGITETNEAPGYDIVYLWLASSLLLCAPLACFLPNQNVARSDAALPAANLGSGCLLMLGIILIGSSMMAYYAFLERLAVLSGASSVETGRIIAAAQLAGIIGGLLAAPLSNKLGFIPALLLSTCLHTVSILLAIFTDEVVLLGAAAFFEAGLFIVMLPLFMTLAANLDKKGRWAAAAGGVFIISTALGPFLGALMIEAGGYNALAWLQLLVIPAVFIFLHVNKSTA